MPYKYTHFITQNIAPKAAKSIGVYNAGGKKVTEIPLGRMSPPTKEPLYSFGIVSDVHIQPYNVNAVDNGQTIGAFISWKFGNALRWFEEQGASFVCIPGDFVNRGFVNSNGTFVTDEFGEYKRICDLFPNLPVYECCGNHESMYYSISNNLTDLETYTGNPLTYSVSHDDDLFIFIGQPSQSQVMSDEDFQCLSETLAANVDKRFCFLFVHSYIEEDSGDPGDYRENSIFEDWGTSKTNAFVNLIRQYDNVILIHGHSHMMFELQESDKSANYTEKNGFKSAHTPSLGAPRYYDATSATKPTPEDYNKGQGYIVEVYDDCVVFNGMDLVNNKPIPLGTYKIDT